jgi:ribosomal protein S18 acetylase RimI-like enzyme
MEIIYREKEKQDESQIKKLMVDLVLLMAKFNPNRLPEPHPEYVQHFFRKISGYINQGSGIIYVAETDGKIAGYIAGYIREQSEEDLWEFKQERCGYIPDLFIAEKFRGKGIGQNLMQKAEEFFRAKGCHSMEISVASNNEVAHSLYRKRNFTDRLIEMRKTIHI